jgi:hypothetical protein
MDAQAALDELALLSTQVVEAVIVDDGTVAGTTTAVQRAAELALVAHEMMALADALRRDGGPDAERVEVTLRDGSVIAVRDGERVIVASTVPEATTGLVLYDLRTALRRSTLPRRRPTRRRATEGARDA